jgi:hypothetical protein
LVKHYDGWLEYYCIIIMLAGGVHFLGGYFGNALFITAATNKAPGISSLNYL